MKNIINFDNKKHILNQNEIDNLHHEFIDIYNSVDFDNINSIINKSKELLSHSKLHFAHEEELMDKYDYPTKKEHKDEHKKVLMEMEYFLKNSNSKFGQKMLKAYYIEKLPYWFDVHLLSMDSDLVSHLNKRGV